MIKEAKTQALIEYKLRVKAQIKRFEKQRPSNSHQAMALEVLQITEKRLEKELYLRETN